MTTTRKANDLIALAQGGDKAAFETLAREAMPRVRGVVQRMVGHPDDSEDIVQDAMMKAWQAMPAFKAESLFSTWLVSIATHLAIDHLRKQKRWRTEAQIAYANICAESEEAGTEVMGAYMSPDFSFEIREHIAYCFTCVGRSLPPDEQAALVLRDVMDMSNREAATVLNVSESLLRHRLSAARNAMVDKYEGLCALVNKQGMCHQCKGLRDIAPPDKQGEAIPDISDFAKRCAIVASVEVEKRRCRPLHDVFWRRTKEIEDAGIGSTTPMTECGQD